MSIALLLSLLLGGAGFASDSAEHGQSQCHAASTDDRGAAAEVFHCTFDRAWDADYDGWPTGWTRRAGPGYPQYVEIKLHQEPKDPPNAPQTSLRVVLNGGATAAYSPVVKVNPLLSYVLEAAVKAQGLRYNRGSLSLTLMDENRVRLQTIRSPPTADTDGWKRLRLGPVDIDRRAKLAVIGLHVEPEGELADLRGTVCFADLWLGCLPRLNLSCNRPCGIVSLSEPVEIACEASGFFAPEAKVEFQLEDRLGKVLAAATCPLAPFPAEKKTPPCWVGKARWTPLLAEAGFYRVRASVGRQSTARRGALTLAVLAPGPAPTKGEFGWTLSPGDPPLAQPLLTKLLRQSGVKWVTGPTSGGLRAALDAAGIESVAAPAAPARWAAIEPLSQQTHAPDARADDLLHRIVEAKTQGAPRILCPVPFGADCGLMQPDGSASDLLLPWRTAATLLGGGRYLGALRLPGGSANALFARPGEAVLAIWSPQPREEVVCLGPDLRQVDPWGRETTPPERGPGRVLRTGPMPTFVVGLTAPLARWQLLMSLEKDRLPAIPLQPHANTLRLKNTFAAAVDVAVRLSGPQGWLLRPAEMRLRLAAGAETKQPFRIVLPPDAVIGPAQLAIDFDLRADRAYAMHVERPMAVGLGDVDLRAAVRLNQRGELEVRQTMVNTGQKPADFRCELFAPGRRRQASEVIALGQTPDEKLYRLPDGWKLLGKTLWLRAAEDRGERILNFRLVVE